MVDLAGRALASLRLPAVRAHAAWSASDDAGRPLASPRLAASGGAGAPRERRGEVALGPPRGILEPHGA